MEQLTELGYKITYSAACPIISWGKWVIHAKIIGEDGVLKGMVAGYGNDEATSIEDAIKTIKGLGK